MKKNNITMEEASAIIKAFERGLPPNKGLQHVVVGREKEISAFMNDFFDIQNGQSILKFWIGDYGIGKSFLLHILNQVALRLNFVVMHIDMNNERLFYDRTGNRALNLYKALVNSIMIKQNEEIIQNSLKNILDNWIDETKETLTNENFNEEKYINDVTIINLKEKIINISGEYSDIFYYVISLYIEAHIFNDIDKKKKILNWLKGNYPNISTAKREIGNKLNFIIDNNNYYHFIKLLSKLFKIIGYKGLLINIDEASTILFQTNKIFRDKNYEKLLFIYNDIVANGKDSIYINITATNDFIEDQYKGIVTHKALKTRLKLNEFETNEFRDFSQPMIKLLSLSNEEIFVLLDKIVQIYNIRYNKNIDFNDEDIRKLMNLKYKNVSSDLLTPRDFAISLIQFLNILRQNPDYDKEKLFNEESGNNDDNITIE